MITRIEVNGFKSLTNFELNLQTGLNILVGPNGVGKTNVILFFEFLSQLMKTPLAKSVSTLGGAGSIFQKIGAEKYSDVIEFKIFGSRRTESKKYIVYEYYAKIRASFDDDTIFFEQQRIQIRTASKFWASPKQKFYKSKWDLDVEYINLLSSEAKLQIHVLDRRKFKARFLLSEKTSKNELFEELEKFALEQDPANKPIL